MDASAEEQQMGRSIAVVLALTLPTSASIVSVSTESPPLLGAEARVTSHLREAAIRRPPAQDRPQEVETCAGY
jgi:hypothetical protein